MAEPVASDRHRILSLDALRGIAVFLMIEQHLGVWLWGGPRSGEGIPWVLLVFNALGGAAAPLFVTLAGIGSALFSAASRPNIDRTLVLRGTILLGFGLVLNLMTPSWFSWGSWFVLHMMGFAMALAPLWRRLPTPVLLAGIVVILAATVVVQNLLDTPMRLENTRMRDVTLPGGPFRLALAESQFPILPWLSFFLAGFVAGRWIHARRAMSIGTFGLALLGIGGGMLLAHAMKVPIAHHPTLERAFAARLGFFPASPAMAMTLMGVSLIAVWEALGLERRHGLSPRNMLVTLGRASLTLLLVHVWLFREATRPIGLWQSCSTAATLAILFGFVAIAAAWSRLWARSDYKWGAEWLLRKLGR